MTPLVHSTLCICLIAVYPSGDRPWAMGVVPPEATQASSCSPSPERLPEGPRSPSGAHRICPPHTLEPFE